MLQRSSLPTTSPAEIADTLQRTLDRTLDGAPFDGATWGGRRWQALQDLLPLPVTWQQYALSCLALAIVVGGLCLQVLLSVQIARAEYTLRQLRSDYARVERQNSELVYAIAQQSSLSHMASLAAQNGYVPATGRTYVVRRLQDTEAARQGALPPALRDGNPPASVAAPSQGSLTWVERASQQWQELQQSVTTATGQLWRDVTGRME
jgi:hypothetical protein